MLEALEVLEAQATSSVPRVVLGRSDRLRPSFGLQLRRYNTPGASSRTMTDYRIASAGSPPALLSSEYDQWASLIANLVASAWTYRPRRLT